MLHTYFSVEELMTDNKKNYQAVIVIKVVASVNYYIEVYIMMWIVINYSVVLHSVVIEACEEQKSEDCDLGEWITHCYPACCTVGCAWEKRICMT